MIFLRGGIYAKGGGGANTLAYLAPRNSKLGLSSGSSAPKLSKKCPKVVQKVLQKFYKNCKKVLQKMPKVISTEFGCHIFIKKHEYQKNPLREFLLHFYGERWLFSVEIHEMGPKKTNGVLIWWKKCFLTSYSPLLLLKTIFAMDFISHLSGTIS